MKIRISVFAFLVCLCVFKVAPLRAQAIGTLDEVIATARNGNEEPQYIHDLKSSFGRVLRSWAATKKIHSPREQIALWVTMVTVIETYWGAAGNAAFNAGYTKPWGIGNTICHPFRAKEAHAQTACSAAFEAVKNAVLDVDEKNNRERTGKALKLASQEIYYSVYVDACKEATRIAFEAIRPLAYTSDYIGRVASRSAEWAALNHILRNAKIALNVPYEAALTMLPKKLGAHPFSNIESWREFRTNQFGSLNKEAMVFLEPWLSLNDFLMNPCWTPRYHSFFTNTDQYVAKLLLWIHKLPQNALNTLPKDLLLFHIIPHVIKENAALRFEF